MKKTVSLMIVLFLALILSSCGTLNFTESNLVTDNYQAEGEYGYIYGRFTLRADNDDALPLVFNVPVKQIEEGTMRAWGADIFGNPTIQFVLNDGVNSFRLEEDPSAQLQLMAVPVGVYQIKTTEYLDYEFEGRNYSNEGTPFEYADFNGSFTVEANKAVYVGDYNGKLGRTYDNNLFWTLEAPTNNFEGTTEELKMEYAFLTDAGVTFENNVKENVQEEVTTFRIDDLPYIQEELEVKENEGVVYGRFFDAQYMPAVDGDFRGKGLVGKDRLLIEMILENIETGDEFELDFRGGKNLSLKAYSLPVGTYVIKEFKMTNIPGYFFDNSFFPDSMTGYREIVVTKDSALYLGDFTSITFQYVSGDVTYDVLPYLDKFEDTTEAFFEKYPQFMKESTEVKNNIKNDEIYPWDTVIIKIQ